MGWVIFFAMVAGAAMGGLQGAAIGLLSGIAGVVMVMCVVWLMLVVEWQVWVGILAIAALFLIGVCQ